MKIKSLTISSIILFFVFILLISFGLIAQVRSQQQKEVQTLMVQPKIDVTFKPSSPTNRDKITFTATPNNPSVVKKVEFWLNAKKIGEDSRAPWTITRGPYSAGEHSIGAVSYDAAGKKLAKKYTHLRIKEADIDLSIKFSPLDPTNRDTITVKAIIPVQRNIKRMVFYKDAVKVGEDKVYPWEFKGGPYPAKRYTFGAEAYDIAGNPVGRKYTSLAIKFYPVELRLTHSPKNPTSQDKITFMAGASDRRDISKVEFFVNARSIGVDKVLPWRITKGPFPKGLITYGFVIYDKTGRKQGSKYAGVRIE
jgi:hypothetical protein